LALGVGAEVLPKFPDGEWLVDLAPVRFEEMVLPAVAAVLGIGAQSGEPLITTVLSCLVGKRLLVILDNCEHVIAPVARFVERVAASASEVRVLVTSREALGISAERVRPVSPLAEDSEAVELLVQQAVKVDPSFDADASLESVQEVCRRPDGIPLAIELAAARSRHMSSQQIAERLDQRLRLLTVKPFFMARP
jgi:predicted ATPase